MTPFLPNAGGMPPAARINSFVEGVFSGGHHLFAPHQTDDALAFFRWNFCHLAGNEVQVLMDAGNDIGGLFFHGRKYGPAAGCRRSCRQGEVVRRQISRVPEPSKALMTSFCSPE